tara:strand:- start:210 stop:767 length:558 start_codon:yes stop_codon:yes gene_type:complete
MVATFDQIGEAIASAGSVRSLEVSGIDQDFNDLHIIFEGFTTGSGQPDPNTDVYIRVNGETSSSLYSQDVTIQEGDGSFTADEIAPSTHSGWKLYNVPNVASGNIGQWAHFAVDINNYTTTTNKLCTVKLTTVRESWSYNGALGMASWAYHGTAAITSISVNCDTSHHIGGNSVLTVYGIKNDNS